MLVVTVDVLHPHHHRVTILPISHSLFCEDDGAIADVQLRAVISNSQTQSKTEGVAKPVGGLADIRIGKHGDHRTHRH